MKNQKRPFHLLVHPLYLISLTLLISNDWYFKATFHNFWTGKLSDLAGLFIFPIFFSVIFPKYVKTIHWLTALLFLFWKTEWSQPLLDWILQLGWTFERVVDYSDLVAIGIIPLAFLFYKKNESTVPFLRFQLKYWMTNAVLIVSFIAFCATTPIHRAMIAVGDYRLDKDFATAVPDSIIVEKFRKAGYDIQKGIALPTRFIHFQNPDQTKEIPRDSIVIDTAEYLRNHWCLKDFPVYDTDTLRYLNIAIFTMTNTNYQDKKRNTDIVLKGICTAEGQVFEPKEIRKLERHLKRKIKKVIK